MGTERNYDSLEVLDVTIDVVDGVLMMNKRSVESIIDRASHTVTIADPGDRLELVRRAFMAGVRACGGQISAPPPACDSDRSRHPQ